MKISLSSFEADCQNSSHIKIFWYELIMHRSTRCDSMIPATCNLWLCCFKNAIFYWPTVIKCKSFHKHSSYYSIRPVTYTGASSLARACSPGGANVYRRSFAESPRNRRCRCDREAGRERRKTAARMRREGSRLHHHRNGRRRIR